MLFLIGAAEESQFPQTFQYRPEQFFFVHQRKKVPVQGEDVLVGRRFIPPEQPVPQDFDPSMLLHFSLSHLVPPNAFRSNDPKERPVILLFRGEHIPISVLSACVEDIVVPGDLPYEEEQICIMPSKIVTFVTTQRPKWKLYGYDPNQGADAVQILIEQICKEHGRIFIKNAHGGKLTQSSELKQEGMRVDFDRKKVLCYWLPPWYSQEWQDAYQKDPLGYVEMQQKDTRKSNAVTHFKVTLVHPDGCEKTVDEPLLIKSLFGAEPATDLEGVWKRYESNLLTFSMLMLHNPRNVVAAAFNDDCLSQSFIGQVEADFAAMFEILSSRCVIETQKVRLGEFERHHHAMFKLMNIYNRTHVRLLHQFYEMWAKEGRETLMKFLTPILAPQGYEKYAIMLALSRLSDEADLSSKLPPAESIEPLSLFMLAGRLEEGKKEFVDDFQGIRAQNCIYEKFPWLKLTFGDLQPIFEMMKNRK